MGFVIHLMSSTYNLNHYGYWTGGNYIVQGELYPITDDRITERTKVYKTKKVAENSLKKCLERGYAYVTEGDVQEVNLNEQYK